MPPKNGENALQIKVRLTKAILKAVDDYRFENRLESRNQAILELLHKGVAAAGGGGTGSANPA